MLDDIDFKYIEGELYVSKRFAGGSWTDYNPVRHEDVPRETIPQVDASQLKIWLASALDEVHDNRFWRAREYVELVLENLTEPVITASQETSPLPQTIQDALEEVADLPSVIQGYLLEAKRQLGRHNLEMVHEQLDKALDHWQVICEETAEFWRKLGEDEPEEPEQDYSEAYYRLEEALNLIYTPEKTRRVLHNFSTAIQKGHIHPNQMAVNPPSKILDIIVWAETPEGYDYWCEIHNDLYAYENREPELTDEEIAQARFEENVKAAEEIFSNPYKDNYVYRGLYVIRMFVEGGECYTVKRTPEADSPIHLGFWRSVKDALLYINRVQDGEQTAQNYRGYWVCPIGDNGYWVAKEHYSSSDYIEGSTFDDPRKVCKFIDTLFTER